eukprot:2392015-Amphidinium_carterae.1
MISESENVPFTFVPLVALDCLGYFSFFFYRPVFIPQLLFFSQHCHRSKEKEELEQLRNDLQMEEDSCQY